MKKFTLPLNYKNITLRPMRESDLVDEERWNTVETEWGEWDAPWEEDEPFDMEAEREKLLKKIANPPVVYSVAELDTDEGRHIGGLNHYYIDDDKSLKAVGIAIPPIDARRNGYGKNAFILWIAYHFANSDAEEIYTQTWSGNMPMIKLAEGIGFVEIGRIKGIRKVRGAKYDALTFSITRIDFYKRHKDVEVGK
ncbi:MAG: GNAT family N-acetyltransferase [Defluviitaleaceae bacterium]|nr:GNAT family N-acetyltransferase [Defluviitaleaceae bacterium]MCL2275892.1 GNAT family N-acetyltransferase [Defluviitaleaceae bacterium]